MRVSIPVFITFFACASCQDRDLRGSSYPSSDGKTFLVIADNTGGECGPLTVDGNLWSYPINQPGPILPGDHVLACGTSLTITVPLGTVYTLDYWGP